MSTFTIPINISNTGRIGSISPTELAHVLIPHLPFNTESSNGMVGAPSNRDKNRMLVGAFPDTGGYITETVGSNTYILLSTGNTLVSTPLTFTPSTTGGTIGVANDPTFIGKVTIVDNGTTDTAGLIVTDTTGAGIVTSNNISLLNASGTQTITATGTTGNISSITVTTPTLNLTNAGVTTAVSANSSGILQSTTGGTTTTYLSSTGLQTNITGTAPITVTNNGNGVLIAISPNPTFTTVTTTGGITVGGNITGNSATLSSSLGVTGATTLGLTNITGNLGVTGTTTLNNTVVNGTLTGLTALTVSGTITTSGLVVMNNASVGGALTVTNGITGAAVTGTTSVTVGTVPITVGAGGQLQETVSSVSGIILSSTNTTGTNGVLVTTTTGLTTLSLNPASSPTFANITITGVTTTASAVIGGTTVGGNTTSLLVAGSPVRTTASVLPSVTGLTSTSVETSKYYIFTITSTSGAAYSVVSTVPTGLLNPGLYTQPATGPTIAVSTTPNSHLVITFTSTPASTVGRIVEVNPVYVSSNTAGLTLNAFYNDSTGTIDTYTLFTATGVAAISGLMQAFTTSIQVIITNV